MPASIQPHTPPGPAQPRRRRAGRLALTLLAALGAAASQAVGASPDGKARARRILSAAGVRGGLIVHVGCGSGKLTAALRANDRFVVHGLDADARNVAKARETIRTAGLSGKVWVDLLRGNRLPYAENMVNLLVGEAPLGVSMPEVMRVLVPNGVAYVKRGGEPGRRLVRRSLGEAGSLGEGGWTKTVKPWPADMDEWTHWLHGADGNAVARDKLVGPPRRFQWIAKPLWSRHHHTVPSVTAIVSAKGRLFYIVDDAPAGMDGSAPDKWSLVARDAFNGLKLWQIPMPQWGWKAWSSRYICRFTIPTHMPRRLVAVGDRVYVTLAFNAALTELDAATGKVLRTFDGTKFTDEILLEKGLLVLSVNKGPQKPGLAADTRGDKPPAPPVRKSVAAIQAGSGRMLWKKGDYVGLRSKTGSMDRISHLSMAAGDGQVFFVDGDRIVSLSLTDGREKWRATRPEVPEHKMRYNIRISDMCTLVYHDGIVFFAQLNPDKRIGWREVRGKLHAFSAKTGKQLWSRQCSSWGWGHPIDVFLLRGLVWVHDFKNDFILGLDPKTGALKRKISNREAFDNGHHHRCYRNKATSRYMMTSYRGLEFIDWDSGRTHLNHWVRGTCRLGAMPCNGMVYATPHPCDCYIGSKLNGFLALAPAAKASGFAKATPDKSASVKRETASGARLQKGPAYGKVNPQSAIPNPQLGDWPTYRHDAERSGSTKAAVAGPLKRIWRADIGDRPTAPVVADGRVFAASQSTRELHALNATSGERLWRYTAGGRLDTPPTIHKGLVLFGCADGWVYCLRTSDGELAWRFRAAPEVRLVGAFGGLESAWPVHGSVLVKGDAVYFTAGRSSFLDGGIWAYSLKVDTGEVLSRKRLRSSYTAKVGTGKGQSVDPGLLADLLVAHADGVYMRQRMLFGQADKERVAQQLHSTAGLLDDSWSSRTRWFLAGVPFAEFLIFDAESVYGVRARRVMSGYAGMFAPGAKGYQLFAADRKVADQPKPAVTGKKKKRRIPKRPPQDRWSVSLPVRITAMVLAGQTLFAAGAPDKIYPKDAWAAYEGRKGGKLLVLSPADGRVKTEHDLDAPPVLDGLAAARGRLYVVTMDGKLMCLGAK